MIIQVFSNSMIFPCMELFLVIFQVFHDFQSLWEPCMTVSIQTDGQAHNVLISHRQVTKAKKAAAICTVWPALSRLVNIIPISLRKAKTL